MRANTSMTAKVAATRIEDQNRGWAVGASTACMEMCRARLLRTGVVAKFQDLPNGHSRRRASGSALTSLRERLSSMELAMKIRDFIERGRELYVQCHGHHPGIVSASAPRAPRSLDSSILTWTLRKLKGKLRCSVCGTTDRRQILLIPQTDRQMRQGRRRLWEATTT